MVNRSYVDQGRVVRDTGIERGKMLVYSEDEWRERARAQHKKEMPRRIMKLTVIYIITLLMTSLITSQAKDADAVLLKYLVMVALTIAFVFPIMLAMTKIQRMIDTGPVPGIFEQGLQQSLLVFIPYSEIDSTQRKTFDSEGKTVLLMYPKHDRIEGKRKPHRKPWAIDVEDWGEECVEELEARVRDLHAQGSP